MPQEVIDGEKAIYKAQAMNEGKPENIAEKMVAGRIKNISKKFVCSEQPFVKDMDKSVADVVQETIASIGENIKIRRFSGFDIKCEKVLKSGAMTLQQRLQTK